MFTNFMPVYNGWFDKLADQLTGNQLKIYLSIVRHVARRFDKKPFENVRTLESMCFKGHLLCASIGFRALARKNHVSINVVIRAIRVLLDRGYIIKIPTETEDTAIYAVGFRTASILRDKIVGFEKIKLTELLFAHSMWIIENGKLPDEIRQHVLDHREDVSKLLVRDKFLLPGYEHFRKYALDVINE